jgi:hypothetical protein
MASLLWHFSEKNSIIACNYLFTVVNRIVFNYFAVELFPIFSPKKKKLTKFYTIGRKKNLNTFPVSVGKRQNSCQTRKKHWNSATELMI